MTHQEGDTLPPPADTPELPEDEVLRKVGLALNQRFAEVAVKLDAIGADLRDIKNSLSTIQCDTGFMIDRVRNFLERTTELETRLLSVELAQHANGG